MCGFFGIFFQDRAISPSLPQLERSVTALRHRGPDGARIHSDHGIGLVHTRLSLLDLHERSDQPFWDSTRRFVIVYNGEIYNFAALRTQLESEGIEFRTTSDTEVVLYTLLHFGVQDGMRKLEGMFSFALYDTQLHRLTLARDRLGIKPLYFVRRDGAILFASEIKALEPWHAFEPNVPRILGFLMGQELPASGTTFFEGVEFLTPGSIITVDPNGFRSEQCLSRADYWDPNRAEQLAAMNDEQLIDEFDRLFQQSVQSQLVADAPVGALCSGGVDSSLVMSVAARKHNNLAIFHADLVGRESEFEHAAALARHLKLDLLKVDVTDIDFIERMPDIIRHWEHPYVVQHNSVAFLKVSELIRSTGTKAVLSGEGSDEAFMGYWWMMFDVIGALKRRAAAPFDLPSKIWNKLRRKPNGGTTSYEWNEALGKALSGYERHGDMPAILERIHERFGATPSEKDAMSFEWLGYHLRHLLIRNDTLGMAASIECRYPFLDTEVLRLAVNLPYDRRVRKSVTALDPRHLFFRDKWPVRALADRYIPKELSQRPKWGFLTSAQDRMQIPWRLFKDSWISASLGISNRNLETMFESADPGLKIRLLQTFVWGQMFLQGTSESAIVDLLATHLRFPNGSTLKSQVPLTSISGPLTH